MKVPASPIALIAFSLVVTAAPALAADRDPPARSTPQIALQSAPDRTQGGTANCLLPGEIRSFGSITIVTARRAVTLATADCIARGGQPIDAAVAD